MAELSEIGIEMRMTLANIITLARLALIPPILALLLGKARPAAFALLVVFLAGDLVDGALARARGEVTSLGKVLDPLADKLLAAGVMAAFAALGVLPWLAFALLAFQQLALLVGSLVLARRGGGELPGARALGKAAAAAISLGLILTFFEVPGYRELIYLGIALSYLAGIDYLRLGLTLARRGSSPPPARG